MLFTTVGRGERALNLKEPWPVMSPTAHSALAIAGSKRRLIQLADCPYMCASAQRK
jgi:hypothetical protein